MKKKYLYTFIFTLTTLVSFSNLSSILLLNEGQCIELVEKEAILSHKDIKWYIASYIFGAIFETFIFNFMILMLLQSVIDVHKKHIFSSIIASIPFGLVHNECINSILITFIMGIILNLFYLYTYNLFKSYKKTFFYTTLLHLITNLFLHIIQVFDT